MTPLAQAAYDVALDHYGHRQRPSRDEPELDWIPPIYANGYLKHPGRVFVSTWGWRDGGHSTWASALAHHALLLAPRRRRMDRKALR